MDHVGGGLYIADIDQAGTHRLYTEREISTVVQLTYQPPDEGYPENVSHDQFEMMDGPRNDRRAMKAAIEKTVERLAAGDRVVVHCSAGSSRSVGVAAGALSLHEGITFADALQRIAEIKRVYIHDVVQQHARLAVQQLDRAD